MLLTALAFALGVAAGGLTAAVIFLRRFAWLATLLDLLTQEREHVEAARSELELVP